RVMEYSGEELLARLSDPLWFQAFGCVLGFDWHSSGLTTTVTGALKESLKGRDIGIAVCGGKGKASRKTPAEVLEAGQGFSLSTKKIDELRYASRMSAKVDSAAVIDGYQLYHHVFFFSEKLDWAVVQQGMNEGSRYARRYHWSSCIIGGFVDEPHSGICGERKEKEVLDMTAKASAGTRDVSVEIIRDDPRQIREAFSGNGTLHRFLGTGTMSLSMPSHHHIIDMDKRNLATLEMAHEMQPRDYEELLGIRGVGAKSIRALAMLSDIIYGKPPSWKDPVKFSFAHGGKDGIPYPVDRESYDRSIEMLRSGIENAKLGDRDRMGALKRLSGFF
ncbi:MAG: DUF763 domain-containing protein, partial [Candidatus Aenigmatarchaeota archaeon]